jgi:uncharacterized protein YlxW (UPF0749 family)
MIEPLFGAWDALTAFSTFGATVVAVIGLWFIAKAFRASKEKDDRELRDQREEAIKEAGRQEERDKNDRALDRIKVRDVEAEVAEIGVQVKKIVDGAAAAQSLDLKQSQRTELGHLKKRLDRVEKKVETLKEDVGKVHADYFEHKRDSDQKYAENQDRLKAIENRDKAAG